MTMLPLPKHLPFRVEILPTAKSWAPPPHPFAYDPTYGYSLADLLSLKAPPAPEGFKEFWEQKIQRAKQVDLHPKWLEAEQSFSDHTTRAIQFSSTDGLRIHAWVLAPKSGKVRHLGVIGHGYGGRQAPDTEPPLPESACIFPCARGLSLSPHPDIPASSTATHVVHGIASREAYIHGGCVEDYACAASLIQSLYPEASENLYYCGGSFGGGIGALLLASDTRFRAGFLRDPSFGHYPLRVRLPCRGSGAHISKLFAAKPEILEVLQWHDAASAARFIQIPVMVAASLFDPAVAPPGQFAVFNAIARKDKFLCIKTTGHFPTPQTPEEARLIALRQSEFLASCLNSSPNSVAQNL